MRRDYRGIVDPLQAKRRRRNKRRRPMQPMEAFLPRRATSKPRYLVVQSWKRYHPDTKRRNWASKVDLPDKKRKRIIWSDDVIESDDL